MRIRREPTDEEQREGRGCLLLIAASIGFVLSTWFTYREVVYALVARPAAADVVSTEIVEYRGETTVVLRRVGFEFRDEADRLRKGVSDLDRDSQVRTGDRVPIQFTDREDYPPRLLEERRWGMILLCGALLGLVLVQGTRLWLEARAAVRESAAHEERRRREAHSDRPVPRRDPEPFS